MKRFILCFLIIVSICPSFTQTASNSAQLDQGNINTDKGLMADTTTDETAGDESIWWLNITVLGIGALLLVLESIVVINMKARWSPYSVIRLFGLTLILVSALFIIVSPEAEASKPVVGLLGALAGYLLGKDPKTAEGDIPDPENLNHKKQQG